MSTSKYGYHTPVSTPLESKLQKAHSENWSQSLEMIRTQYARQMGRGFWGPSDIIATAIAGTLGVQVSPGNAYLGPDGDYTHVHKSDIETVQNGVGGIVVVNSTTNYFWLKADGTWTVNTTGVNPVPNSAMLAFSGVAGATDFITGGSLNNDPVGRINLPLYEGKKRDKITVVTGAYAVTLFDDIIEGNGTFTVTLLAPSRLLRGLSWEIVNIGGGVVTVAPASGLVNGASNVTLSSQWASKKFYCDGTNYRAI